MSETPTARRWRRLVKQHRTSGLSCRAFAEANNVNPATFSWWRCELRRRDRQAGEGEPEPTFTALTVAKPVGQVALQLDEHPARIIVDRDTDLDLVRQLLVVLG